MFLRLGPVSFLHFKGQRYITSFTPSSFAYLFKSSNTELLEGDCFYILQNDKNLTSFVANSSIEDFTNFIVNNNLDDVVPKIYEICAYLGRMEYLDFLNKEYEDLNHNKALVQALSGRQEKAIVYLINKIGRISPFTFRDLVKYKMENIIASMSRKDIKNNAPGDIVAYFIDADFSTEFIKKLLFIYIREKGGLTLDQIKLREKNMFMTAWARKNVEVLNLLSLYLNPFSLEGFLGLDVDNVTFYNMLERKVPIVYNDINNLVKNNNIKRLDAILGRDPSWAQKAIDIAYVLKKEEIFKYIGEKGYIPNDEMLKLMPPNSPIKRFLKESEKIKSIRQVKERQMRDTSS